jgi:alpha-beta hydrolase superfamily lysophospholipase
LLRGLPGSIAASQGGRLAAANLGAFALEGLAFAGSHRGLAQAFGHVLPEGSLSFAQELGHAYLTLGLLKSLSGVAGAGVRRYTLPTLERQSLSSLQHLGRFALPQAAMYSGIYLSSAWAPGLGLGENPGDDLALTSLVTLLQFNLSGMVLNKVPGFHRLNQSIQMQTELAIRETGARFRQHLEETFRIPPGMGGEMVPAKGVFMSSDRRQARLDTDFRINRMTATGSSGEGLIDNGPFGKFSREVFAAQGTAVYTPVGDTVTKIPGAKRNVILIAGAWLDHTCFTELPQQIHQRGHGIKIISFPGHEIADPVSLQQRPAKELAESWQRALKETVERLLEKDPSTPVVLGGFSLGGAAALGIYANLDPALQGRISGLILGAPALAFPLLETSVIGPLNRRVLLPLYSRFSEKPVQGPNRYTRSNVPGGLAAHVQFKEERTWSSRHAAVLLGEAARGDLLKLKEHPNLPPVLVIHGGRTDLTVSSRAAELVQETFGKKAHSLNLAKRFSRHLVFVFRGRQRAFDRIHQFLAENK